MNTGWSWVFLLAVFAGLCFLAMIIGVMVLLFRARPRGPPAARRVKPDAVKAGTQFFRLWLVLTS